MGLKNRIVEIAYELKDKFTGTVGKITGGFKDIEKASDKSSKNTEKNNKRVEKSFRSLKRVVVNAGKAIIGNFVGISGVAVSVFNATKTFQQLNASLKTVTGSAEEADKAFEFISGFAKTTPFELTKVADAFIKLKALGLDPSEDALRSYGNTAAAMGKDLNQFIEAVADASTNEFERLKGFGITAKQQGDQVSFTFQGVTTTVQKNAAAIEGYLRDIGNTQFAGAMTEQMKTVGGQLSNLKDSFFTLAIEIGKSGAGDASGSIMTDIANVVQQTTDLVIKNGAVIRDSFNSIIGSVRFFGNIFIIVFNGTQIVLRGLVRAMFGFAADINTALSAVTFGETSKEFAYNAQAMRDTMSQLEQDIKRDVKSAANAAGRLGDSFNSVEVKKNIETSLKGTTAEVDVFMRPDVQAAIASINSTRDQAQKQIKPIVIPVVYENKGGNSFSDRPINNDLDRSALTGGKR